MKKPILKEEILRMRKIMGVNENYESYNESEMTDENEDYNTEESVEMNEGSWEVDPAYTHFAVNKNTGKIVNGWEYSPDTDKESISYYCKLDLQDMDYNPKDFKINTKRFLERQGIDPFNSDNWESSHTNDDQAMINAHDEEEANKYASKNYDDVESGAIDEGGKMYWHVLEDGGYGDMKHFGKLLLS